MHKEDVKAVLRKHSGSVAAFERTFGLPAKSVSDVLRGHTNGRVTKAIEKVLTEANAPHHQAECSGSNVNQGSAHRLNAGVR